MCFCCSRGRVGSGSRLGRGWSPGGAGEASGGVRLVSFLWARADLGFAGIT